MSKGLSGAGFDIDLAEGKARERSLASILADGALHVEVKSDKKCRDTGNLFIEFAQPTGPSGLATTKARFWAFEYDDDCWIIVPVIRLKELARIAYRQKKRVHGGDYDRYKGVLVPLHWLLNSVRK